MKKKLLLGFVLFVSLFLICGCGSSDSKENEVDDGSGKEEVEPSVQGTGNPDEDLDGAYGEEQEIELYSDDTKIVFKNGNNKVYHITSYFLLKRTNKKRSEFYNF